MPPPSPASIIKCSNVASIPTLIIQSIVMHIARSQMSGLQLLRLLIINNELEIEQGLSFTKNVLRQIESSHELYGLGSNMKVRLSQPVHA